MALWSLTVASDRLTRAIDAIVSCGRGLREVPLQSLELAQV